MRRRHLFGALALGCVASATPAVAARTNTDRATAAGRDAEARLLSQAPVQLHPFDTTDAVKSADNTTNLLAPKPLATTGGPEVNGVFGTPFQEPTLGGKTTDAKCIQAGTPNGGLLCKPAAGTLVNLPNGKILFWDALEGTENNKFSIVAEGGATFTNDSARTLDLGADDAHPVFGVPKQFDGGTNANGDPGSPIVKGDQTTETYNDGALFGSHQSFLPDGRLLVQGGTDYSLEPGVNGIPFGAVELTGLKATRIYNPATNDFTATGDTAYRRWYPTLVEGGDGRYFDFGGVGKLIKPVYTPGGDGTKVDDSLQNVRAVERFDPATSKWTTLPTSADRDLPLYPRMHLLPDGHLFYNADGQDFNPFGQSAGELSWGTLASLDPSTNKWTDLGQSNTTTPTAPGFRASTSSTMLPLTPNADGTYSKASFLTAGGVLLPSPGSYFTTNQSSITTVDTSAGKERQTQKATGPLPAERWFGQNIVLPTGQVMQFSGADKDEVVLPGTEFPMPQANMFDPQTNKWSPVAVAHNPRTYHNTAVLLPSGEVLVGGHATISTGYLNNTTLPGGFAPHDGRDPSFEIYKPPYLFRGARPAIKQTANLMGYGQTLDVTLAPGTDAKDVDSVALVHNSAITHIVDADQRTVMLPVIARDGQTVTVATPPNGNVAPPGPYMLFVNKKTDKGLVPSTAAQLFVTTDTAKAQTAAAKVSATRTCVSRRAFSIRVPKAYRSRLRSVRVTVAGTLVKSLKGRKSRAAISLKGRPKGATTVKLVMTLKGGRKVTDTRVYHPCTARTKRKG